MAQRQELDDARKALAQERAASTAAAEAAASVKASLNLTLASVLTLKKKLDEAPAADAVEPLLNALREADERQLAQLEEERVKLVENHLATLGSAEDRIREQREMISAYSMQIGDLRNDLHNEQQKSAAQAKAAAREAAQRQDDLTRKHREREAELTQQLQDLKRAYWGHLREAKTQLETAQGQLTEAQLTKNLADGAADKSL